MRLATFVIAALLPISWLSWHDAAAQDDVEHHIERLRSSGFEEREDATRALIAAGERSVAAAQLAALDDDLEVQVRALRVLLTLAVSPEEKAAHAAEAALYELAKSKDVAIAKLARDSFRAAKEFHAQQRQVHIAALRKLGGVALLNESGEVYRIDFEGQYITDEGLEARRAGRVLDKPDADDEPAEEGKLSNVEFVSKYIVKTRVTDGDLAILKKFPALTYLNMQQTEATDAGLVHLQSLRKLEYLILDSRISDAGLTHLAKLTQLKSLSLCQTQVTGIGLAHLADLSHLEELNLTNSPVDDGGLQRIASHEGLLTLKLGNTRITDEGASHLSRLRKLNLLTLHGTAISDAGLRAVAMLDDLRSLMLDGTQVSDRGISQLAGLAHLQAVSFTELLVTKEGVQKLRAQMPKTNIHLWPQLPRR